MKTNSPMAQQLARRIALAGALTIVLVALACSLAATQEVAATAKSLQVGASEVLDFQGIKRAVVSDPTVADYVVLSARQIMLSGKASGATDFYVWDDKGQHAFRVTVVPAPTRAAEMVPRIAQSIGHPAVRVSEHNGVIILEGVVDTPQEAQRAEAIASAYAPNVRNLVQVVPVPPPAVPDAVSEIQEAVGPDIKVRALGEKTLLFEGTTTPEQKRRMDQILKALGHEVTVVDMVYAPQYAPRQILVRVKVVDINKDATSDIGIDWGGLTEQRTVFDRFGQETSLASHDQPITFGEVFTGPLAVGEGGPIRRLQGLSARLNALVTDGKARILAEPNLLVIEGETADMLVGGEIPLAVVQSVGGQATTTVVYKEFGVKLKFNAWINADGKTLNLDVNPEVSSLDFSVIVLGSPALRTRRAHSVLHIADGQTIVIGGLYQSETSTSIRKVPLLGDIPLLGELFKRTDKRQQETELVIFVTPEIVTDTAAAARTAAAVEKVGEGK